MLKKLTREEYDSIDALNSSALKDFLKSPAHYKAFNIDKREKRDTEAMRFGRLVHQCIFEPETITKIRVSPNVKRNTKDGKAAYQEFLDSVKSGEIVLTDGDSYVIQNICEAINRTDHSRYFISNGHAEMTGVFEVSGIKCKMRCDFVHNDGYVVDLKTTSDASEYNFHNQMKFYSMDVQAAFYLLGADALGLGDTFVWVYVEKEMPFLVNVFYATMHSLKIKAAIHRIKNALEEFKTCKETNNWYGYSDEPISIG